MMRKSMIRFQSYIAYTNIILITYAKEGYITKRLQLQDTCSQEKTVSIYTNIHKRIAHICNDSRAHPNAVQPDSAACSVNQETYNNLQQINTNIEHEANTPKQRKRHCKLRKRNSLNRTFRQVYTETKLTLRALTRRN
ncbi:hypothetical protein YC2023_035332 [Brassica napus]